MFRCWAGHIVLALMELTVVEGGRDGLQIAMSTLKEKYRAMK